jgi:methyl-accepting chemotaxis protein
MDANGKQGFMKDLSVLLNQLSDVTDGGLKDVTRVAKALADGDLSQTIEKSYPGLFGQTGAGVNQTVTALNAVVEEIHTIVDAANRGDFSSRIDLSGKQGYTRTLGDLLNQLSDVTDNGLKDIRRVAEALATGDLTQSITQQYPGVFGQTTGDMNATVANLQRLVSEIKTSVDAINTAAKEIAAGNTDLSSRTEEQASSLEETSSSMEELSSAVKNNAENARQANEQAGNAQAIAVRGGEVVGQVVETMGAIHQSSSKIADIIGVIDGIAFQTNILALNAAVEAARAGEQGRGFAVVATEVRNLAQRSAAAAKEIKGLISDSVSKVEVGNRLAATAGETMDEVVASIRKVTKAVTEITEASHEQSGGIEQVSKAVSQMDEVTQQNAALVEQAAAAAESLEEQAEQLTRAVAAFRIAANDSPVISHSPARLSAPAASPARPASPVSRLGRKPLAALPPSLNDEWKEF